MGNDDNISVSVQVLDQFTSQLGAATTAIKDFTDKTNAGLGGTTSHAKEAQGAVFQFANEGVAQLQKLALEFFALGEMVKTLKEGLKFSDQIRDAEQSIRTLAGTVESGEAVFAKFRATADSTRNTTLELANAWRDALPAAMRRGIGDDTLGSITVQLSKIAPLLGKSLDDVMGQWEQIMAGRVRKTSMLANLLLGGTGYTIEDLTGGGKSQEIFKAMFANMDKLAEKGEGLGQTLESVGKKIKDRFFEAFAEGFTSATGNANAYTELLRKMSSTEILEGFKNIGQAIRDILPGMLQIAEFVAKIAKAPAAVGGAIGEGVPTGTTFGDWVFAITSGKLGTPSGGNLTSRSQSGAQATALKDAANGFEALDVIATQVAHSFDKVSTSVAGATDKIKEFKTATEATVYSIAPGLDPIDPNKAFGASAGKAVSLIGGPSDRQFAATVDQISKWTEEERKKDAKSVTDARAKERQADYDSIVAAGDEFKKSMDQLGKGVIDLLTGKGLGGLSGLLPNAGQGLGDLFSQILGPLFGVTQEGNAFKVKGVSGQFNNFKDAVGAGNKAGNAPGVGLALDGVGAFASGFSSQQSDLATAGGGLAAAVGIAASTGWTGYGLIAAAVVAVGTYLGKLFQPSPSADYKYGTPGVNASGTATFAVGQNIDTNLASQIKANIQGTYNTFFDAFNSVLTNLGQSTIGKFGVSPRIGQLEAGADIGNAASREFDAWLNQWISTGMPRAIAAKFFDPIQKGFEPYLSGDAFKGLWNNLMTLDPTKFKDALTALSTALPNLAKNLDFFSKTTGLGNQNPFFTSGANELGSILQGEDFFAGLRKNQTDTMAIVNRLQNDSTEQQIADITTISQMTDQRYQSEVAFIKQVQSTIESITSSADAQIFNYQLAGMQNADGTPNKAQQSAFLQTRLNYDFGLLSRETDPNKVKSDTDDALKVIDQIVKLGGSTPELLQWGIEQTKKFENESLRVLKMFGDQVDKANQTFLSQFTPAFDGYKKKLEESATSLGGFNGAVNGGTGSILNFTSAVDAATTALDSLSGSDHHQVSTQSRRAAAAG